MVIRKVRLKSLKQEQDKDNNIKSFNRISFILLLSIMLIGFTSAWTSDSFSLNNEKIAQYEPTLTKYGEYIIEQSKWYDPLKIWTKEEVKRITLENNTDFCGDNCMAEGLVNLSKDSIIFEDIEWLRSFDNQKSWVEWDSFTNWKIYIENKNRYVEVPVYETQCLDTKELSLNGTVIQDCYQVEIGTEIIDNGEWEIYNFKKVYPADNYKWKIEGGKKDSTVLDWVLTTSEGVRLSEWAVWGNISAGDDAEVILNSPDDNELFLVNSVTTNATGNVTGGAYLTNATLYDNSTGTWGARNTTDLITIGVEGLVSYYTLDETSGTTILDVLNNYNGSNLGSEINVSGKINSAYSLDGINDYLSFSTNLGVKNAQPRTYNAWFKWGGDTDEELFNQRHSGDCSTSSMWGSKIRSDGSAIVVYTCGSGSFTLNAGYDVPIDEWFMFTFVYTGTQVILYVNGTEIGRGNNNFNVPTNIPVIVGKNLRENSQFFGGSFDEFSSWNKSLNSTEILTLYNSGAGSRPTGYISYTQTFTNTYSAGDNILWNMLFCDSDVDCDFATENRTFSIEGDAPNIELNYPTTLIDYGEVNETLELNFTATDTNLDSIWYDYNGTNVTIDGAVSGLSNVSDITLSQKRNVTIYANDTAGNLNATTFSWDYSVFENSRTYNPDTFETENEDFIINVTSDARLSSVILNYDDVNYTMSQSGNLWSKSVDIPVVTEDTNNTFYFLLNYDDNIITSTESYQYVRDWNLSYENPYQYINVTIYDEETEEILNTTTLQSVIDYYAGSGTNYLTFADSEEQDGIHEINISNSTVGNINADISFTYSRTGYQQRNYYNDFILTNSTVQNIDLYLLLSDAGILNIFETTESGLADIPGATVRAYKIEGGVETLVDSGVTDDDGQAILFLNPDFLHRIEAVKDGCTTLETNKYPTGGTTSLSMSCGADEGGLEINTSVYEGLSIDFTPSLNSITNGSREFKVNIEDDNCYLTNYEFSLIIDGVTVNSTSGSESCGEDLSLYYNPTSGTIKSYVKVVKNETDIYRSKIYYVTNTENLSTMDKSFYTILTEFQDQDVFGLSNESKTFISFIIIFLIVGGLSMVEGVKADSWGTIIFVEIMIIIFSFIGWLNLGLLPNTTPYYDFLNKFAIAILGAMLTTGIIMLKSER